MRVTSPALGRSVVTLRISAPVALVASVALGIWCWSLGSYALAVTNAFLAGVNLMLTWIEWRWFKL